MSDFFYPVTRSKAEMEIKKSKFISYVFPCFDEIQAKDKIKELKLENKNAAHVVHGFAAGFNKNFTKGMSDDGEPSGTAGKPVLSIIEGKCLVNILVVVVRYFGGIKLGTGGLVKAYSDSANLAIQKAEFKKFVHEKKVKVFFPYEHLGPVLGYLKSEKVRAENEEYTDNVEFCLFIKEEMFDEVLLKLKDITSGALKAVPEGF
ncbi:MAG: YigZ family protein [Desulfobacteraceae bacterium]|nr:YigZ family protein [Desulfobacteraceae bacterium]